MADALGVRIGPVGFDEGLAGCLYGVDFWGQHVRWRFYGDEPAEVTPLGVGELQGSFQFGDYLSRVVELSWGVGCWLEEEVGSKGVSCPVDNMAWKMSLFMAAVLYWSRVALYGAR